MRLVDADAVVGHFHQNRVVGVVVPDLRVPFLRAVVDRVDDEVGEDLDDLGRVPFHHDLGRVEPLFQPQVNLAPPRLGLEALHRFADDFQQIEGHQLDVERARFHLGDDVQIFQQPRHPVDVFRGLEQELAVDLRVVQPALKQRQDESLDVENRRLQLVGEVSDELFPEGVRFPERGDFFDLAVGPGHHIAVDLLDNVLPHVQVHVAGGSLQAPDGLVDDAHPILDVQSELPVDQKKAHRPDHRA